MSESTTPSKTPVLLTAVVILFCLIVLLQLGLLLQRHLHQRALPATGKARPAAVWNSADEMEAMHARINRMFEQAFRSPLSNPQPPAAPVTPPALTRGSAVSSFEDPFEHMRRMQQQIDAMFAGALNELAGPPPGFDEGWSRLEITPGFSIRDTDNTYEITVHLPGVDKSGIQVSLYDSVLSLVVNQTTRTATTTASGATIRESRQASRFERHLRLPGATGNQEDIRAVFEQGVLRITVPRAQKAESGPKSIPVR